MSTRSGKRIHSSPNEQPLKIKEVKTDRKTRSQKQKENNCDNIETVLKKKNYVLRNPSEDDTNSDASSQVDNSRTHKSRRTTLKEINGLVLDTDADITINSIKKTRSNKKIENEILLDPPQKLNKKSKKKQKKHILESTVESELIRGKKKLKKKKTSSGSVVVEDLNEANIQVYKSNISMDSFHSAAGSIVSSPESAPNKLITKTTDSKNDTVVLGKKKSYKNTSLVVGDDHIDSEMLTVSNDLYVDEIEPVIIDKIKSRKQALLIKSNEKSDETQNDHKKKSKKKLKHNKEINNHEKSTITNKSFENKDNELKLSFKNSSTSDIAVASTHNAMFEPNNDNTDNERRSSLIIFDKSQEVNDRQKPNCSIKSLNSSYDKTPDLSLPKKREKKKSLGKDTKNINMTFERDTSADNTTFQKDTSKDSVTFDKEAVIKIKSPIKKGISKVTPVKKQTSKNNTPIKTDIAGDSTFFKNRTSKIDTTSERDTNRFYTTFDTDTSKIDSTSEKETNQINTTFEKDTSKINITFDKDTSRINTTFEKDTSKINTTFEKDTSRINTTFDKDTSRINTTFEKDTSKNNSTFDKVTSKVDIIFEKDTSRINTSFDKDTTVKTTLDGTFNKDVNNQVKSVKNINESNIEKKLNVSFEGNTKLDTTFEKVTEKDNLNDTFDKPDNTSKSSLISSDASNLTDDKSLSRISITSDDSRTENIVNTTPVLIESSIDESIIVPKSPKLCDAGSNIRQRSLIESPLCEKSIEKTPPILQREGTFTKESESPVNITTPPDQSKASPGRTPFPSSKRSSTKKRLLNVTRSIEKSRRLSVAELPRATRVMFCSPVNTPMIVNQAKGKVIKSSMKGSNKSFVFDESVSELVGTGRKRSYTLSDAEDIGIKRKRLASDGQHSTGKLSRSRTSSASGKVPNTTPSKTTPAKTKPDSKVGRKKLPNFAALHQKQFDKMESLDECQERKARRARQMLAAAAAATAAMDRDSKADSSKKVEKKKRLPTLDSINPGYTRFGFKMNSDVNPFATNNDDTNMSLNTTKNDMKPSLNTTKNEMKPSLNTTKNDMKPSLNTTKNNMKPSFTTTKTDSKLSLNITKNNVNLFATVSKIAIKSKENIPNGLKRQATLPSLAGSTARKEIARQAVMREKSFAEKRSTSRKENRTIIKGVRTNRRFELQMQMRNIN